jgi:hypothetical protein
VELRAVYPFAAVVRAEQGALHGLVADAEPMPGGVNAGSAVGRALVQGLVGAVGNNEEQNKCVTIRNASSSHPEW